MTAESTWSLPNRSLAAAGDVAVVGCHRWWRDVYVFCRRCVMQC